MKANAIPPAVPAVAPVAVSAAVVTVAAARSSGSVTAAALPHGWRPAGLLAKVRRCLACLRYGDVLILQGPPWLGAAFAAPRAGAVRVSFLAVFAAASLLLVAHVFAYNDWAGAEADLNDARKAAGAFATRGVSRRSMQATGIILLLASLALFALTGLRPFELALAIAVLSMLYSRPRWPWKGVPILGSLLHLAGGALHFLLGYSLWLRPDDGNALVLAAFCGMVFAAGHLNQEVLDCKGDRLNGIRTNAVVFGRRAAFGAGLALFLGAYTVLASLALRGVLPHWVGALAGAAFLVHLGASWQALAADLSSASIARLRRVYRTLFILLGIALGAALAGAMLPLP